MKSRLLRLLFLLSGIISGVALTYVIKSFPPSLAFHIASITISIIPIFFVLLFSFVFSFVTFVFRRKIHGFLVAAGVTIYILLRVSGFTNYIYLILLIALGIALEFAFTEKKEKE